jgi:hypothetical protein
MNASTKNRGVRVAAISTLLAVVCNLSAHAGIYPFTDNAPYTEPTGTGSTTVSAGVIPQGGIVFSDEHVVSDDPDHSITSVELVLTFNDGSSLTGDGTGIEGHLILGTGASPSFVNFYPIGSPVSDSHERTYDLTFSSFNNLNPNDTWTLALWDNSTSGIENGLVSWTLDISGTAVPEPVDAALAIFGALVAVAFIFRRLKSVRVASNR